MVNIQGVGQATMQAYEALHDLCHPHSTLVYRRVAYWWDVNWLYATLGIRISTPVRYGLLAAQLHCFATTGNINRTPLPGRILKVCSRFVDSLVRASTNDIRTCGNRVCRPHHFDCASHQLQHKRISKIMQFQAILIAPSDVTQRLPAGSFFDRDGLFRGR